MPGPCPGSSSSPAAGHDGGAGRAQWRRHRSDGASPHGQGLATALTAIVAERLDVEVPDITVVSGDTDTTPYGIGSAGSRGLVVAGSATALATERVQRKAIEFAAHLLEAATDDLDRRSRGVEVRGTPTRRLELYDLARTPTRAASRRAWNRASRRPHRSTPRTSRTRAGPTPAWSRSTLTPARSASWTTSPSTTAAGSSALGSSRGRCTAGWRKASRSAARRGRLRPAGPAAHGLVRALRDPLGGRAPELPRDPDRSADAPQPARGQGRGEAGTIGAPAAVVNAVLDALAPLGVRELDMPLTPRRLWEACSSSKGSGGNWKPRHDLIRSRAVRPAGDPGEETPVTARLDDM